VGQGGLALPEKQGFVPLGVGFAIRTSTRHEYSIFVWPVGGPDDTIKGGMFKHDNFSHD
jgi:hypothetical protein